MTQQINSILENMRRFVDGRLAEMYTAIPGVVNSYDPETKTAEVSVLFSDYSTLDSGDADELDYPVLPEVPVWSLGGAGWSITVPIKKGDPVLLIFCQRNIAEWFLTDGSEPVSATLLESQSESAAICIPRLYPEGKSEGTANGEDIIISHTNGKVDMRITKSGEVQVKADAVRLGSLEANKALALAEKVNARFASIESWAQAHTHISNGPAVPTNPALPALSSGSDTSCAKVFANG